MKTKQISLMISLGLALAALAGCKPETPAADATAKTDAGTAPAAAPAFPERPFFGDTHLHTSYSVDAGAFGARLTPRDAYIFAKGNEVKSSSGQQAKLRRPLDFLVVADHSDAMGLFPMLLNGTPEVMADPQGKKWHDMITSGQGNAAAIDIIESFGLGKISPAILPLPGTKAYATAWGETIKAAEEANDPGRFTAFIGFEWTSNTGGSNLHRNVIFRDSGEKAGKVEPYTTMKPLGSDNPVDLWNWMATYEQKTGGKVLAIAHNGNLSNGVMFPTVEAFGKKLDAGYASSRAKWERLYETTQTKGTGESHPYLSPNDELADYEIWDKGNLDGSAAKTKDMLQYEYTREALKNGLVLEKSLGANPYKFGLVGSTDAHTGLVAVEEDNFFGKTAPQEPSPERLTKAFLDNKKSGVKIMDWEVGSSGYAAVWATENTREAIWDAMQRRETYATTGSRMSVRLFGGYDFAAGDAVANTLAKTGYAKGVPMGGDLKAAPAGKAPTFLVAAMKDAIGANLDRYQIIKGWLDKDGKLHEKVYDVSWSDNRKPDPKTGKLPAVGNTVNVADASWTNTIGATELVAVWKDPDFDPAQSAFYYGRVLEIPTPRWTAYDVKRFKNKPLEGTRMTIQERAYTSPIWYSPN
ncbi:MAG: DUF3604 domain-containing protein [Arenimonas sp.]|jgi:hypothetical protein